MQKGKYAVLFCIILFIFSMTACLKKDEEDTGFYIYYKNKEETKIVKKPYETKSKNENDMISELLHELVNEQENVEFHRPFTEGIYVKDWKLNNKCLYLYFNSDYSDLETISEVLGRAAYVRTLIQVPTVDSIIFYVGDSPLVDEDNKSIGFMTADTFVENPEKQINSIQLATVTLYFSDLEGKHLVKEVQKKVPYNTNISMEKFIMERLLNGPVSENKISALPEETKLVSISVVDGVCFVNFEESFLSSNPKISSEIVIYSIVNSLSEISKVNKVQISINGDTNIMFQEKISLDTMFERNYDYLKSKE